jgi:hypothetical protein
MTKTLYTIAWNGFWERFGKDFINQVNNLNTKPDEIIVVSDKPLPDCPYTVLVKSTQDCKPYVVHYFRAHATKHCTSDWCCFSDLDDTMLPNYLDNINDNYDIHAFHWDNMSATGMKHGWENILQENSLMPIAGRSFVKTEFAKKASYTQYGHDDFIHFMILKTLNPRIYFDETKRFIYSTELQTVTNDNGKRKDTETKTIRRLLRQGKEVQKL